MHPCGCGDYIHDPAYIIARGIHKEPVGMQQLFPSLKAVIFDLDGTLYDRRRLRVYMLFEMLRFILRHPAGWKDLNILWDFRKMRERNAHSLGGNIEWMQFNWSAEASRVPAERVRQVVQDWMFTRPGAYLSACCRPGARELFTYLREKGILIGIFSDYPATEKLYCLGLKADAVVSATDSDVDRLKPDPKGLILTASKLKTTVDRCLFVGDRDDKDGECARRAGMSYLILNPKKNSSSGFNSLSDIAEWFRKCPG
jgi:HAD superfamily hydrolase (TIGR01549 family)